MTMTAIAQLLTENFYRVKRKYLKHLKS